MVDIGKDSIRLRLKLSIAVLCVVIVGGTFGFWYLEEGVTSLLDSFFFTLVTVTTIGYGNIIPITVPGKILDIVVILAGVGAAFVSVQTLFEAVVRKKIEEVLKLPKTQTDKKNHVIVCGYGKVGKPLVRMLEDRGEEFIVIEQDRERVKEMVQKKVPVIEGDARKEEVLERAGIHDAKSLLVPLDDSSNVFVALTTKMLNPALTVICKVEDVGNAVKLKGAGADSVISCHDIGAQRMITVAEEKTEDEGLSVVETLPA